MAPTRSCSRAPTARPRTSWTPTATGTPMSWPPTSTPTARSTARSSTPTTTAGSTRCSSTPTTTGRSTPSTPTPTATAGSISSPATSTPTARWTRSSPTPTTTARLTPLSEMPTSTAALTWWSATPTRTAWSTRSPATPTRTANPTCGPRTPTATARRTCSSSTRTATARSTLRWSTLTRTANRTRWSTATAVSPPRSEHDVRRGRRAGPVHRPLETERPQHQVQPKADERGEQSADQPAPPALRYGRLCRRRVDAQPPAAMQHLAVPPPGGTGFRRAAAAQLDRQVGLGPLQARHRTEASEPGWCPPGRRPAARCGQRLDLGRRRDLLVVQVGQHGAVVARLPLARGPDQRQDDHERRGSPNEQLDQDARRPEAEPLGDERRVPQPMAHQCAEQAHGGERGAGRPGALVADHRVPDAGPGQRREQRVAPQAGDEPAREQRRQHRTRTVSQPRRGHGVRRVEDVLDDLEAQAGYRAVHETIHHAVDLLGGEQRDDDHPEQLERLLDDGRRERWPPGGRERGRADLGDQAVQRGVAGHRRSDRDQGAPGEDRRQQHRRLPFEVVQVPDEEHERYGVEPEQHDRERRGEREGRHGRPQHRPEPPGAGQEQPHQQPVRRLPQPVTYRSGGQRGRPYRGGTAGPPRRLLHRWLSMVRLARLSCTAGSRAESSGGGPSTVASTATPPAR